MVRAVLSIVGILATVAAVLVCFGYTTPDITAMVPGMNRSVARTVALEHDTEAQQMRTGELDATPSGFAPGPAGSVSSRPTFPASSDNTALAPGQRPGTPAPHSDEAEIISPDTTAHLNPAHVSEVEQPTPAWASSSSAGATEFNPNPEAFAAPSPLPAHPSWTWEVGNREFTDVVITRVDADMVTITSDSGPAQIDIALLSAELQQELHYNPALATEAAAARKAHATPVTSSAP